MYYLIAHLDGGLRMYAKSLVRNDMVREQGRREARTPEHVCPRFMIVDEDEFIKLRKKETAMKLEQAAARKKRGQERAARTREQNKKNGKKPHFILCPTCKAKSKLLFSEMGGLQTRRCQNGHNFEVDTFFGFESNKRRVERTDRPVFVMGGSYTDYVQGKYKDDPEGKQDR